MFTGSGNVSKGAQELFEHLPHEYVDVSTLKHVAKKGREFFSVNFKSCVLLEHNKVYGCVVTRADHMVPKHGGPFDKTEFNEHPERYTSKFATEVSHRKTPQRRSCLVVAAPNDATV